MRKLCALYACNNREQQKKATGGNGFGLSENGKTPILMQLSVEVQEEPTLKATLTTLFPQTELRATEATEYLVTSS